METTPAFFIDTRGRRWHLAFDFSLAKRVREHAGLDFVNYADGKALLAIHADDEKLVQVLWLLVAEEARAVGIEEEDFGRGLGGDALEQALTALEQALLNFSRPAKRQALEAIRERAHEVVAAEAQMVQTKIRSPKFKQAIDRRIKKVADQVDQAIEKASTAGDLDSNAPRS